jgi:hypothetical protein
MCGYVLALGQSTACCKNDFEILFALSNGGIHLSINYSVLNKTKQNK